MHTNRFKTEVTSGTVNVAPETDDIVALRLEGEFDIANSPRLNEEIDQALTDGKHLIVDLSEATFIDSSVINALFRARNNAATRRRIAVLQLGTAAIVERALQISNIERALPRTHTRAEAIQTIQQYAAEPAQDSPRSVLARRASEPG
jgi:anti-sigma B factor antagonist